MAGDWIKIEHVTPDKPEVWDIAEILDLDPDLVLGKLIRVFVWMDQNCNADGVTSVTVKKMIDRKTGIKGFSDSMIDVGWLGESNGALLIKNFDRHNGKSAKQRALTNKRVSESRKRKCNGMSVTKSLPEKRREEGNINKNNIKKEFEFKEFEKESTNCPYSEIVNMYHTITDFPRLRSADAPHRRKAMLSRWKDGKYDLKLFREAFSKAQSSDFLSGRNGAWGGCNFDWILKPQNWTKILENNYSNTIQSLTPEPTQPKRKHGMQDAGYSTE